MANQPETSTFPTGVYQWETSDPALGGVGGLANQPLLQLASRTRYLYDQVAILLADLSGLAPINSPTFTGAPAAPTPAATAAGTEIITAGWARRLSGGVLAVAISGNYTLSATQAGNGVLVITGTLTGDAFLLFPAGSGRWVISNQCTGGRVLCRQTAGGASVPVTPGKIQGVYTDGTDFVRTHNDYQDAALTGAPSAPTPAPTDNSLIIPNTSWVRNYVGGNFLGRGLGSSNNAKAVYIPGNNETHQLQLTFAAQQAGILLVVGSINVSAPQPTSVSPTSPLHVIAVNGTVVSSDGTPLSMTNSAAMALAANSNVVIASQYLTYVPSSGSYNQVAQNLSYIFFPN